MMQRSSRVTSRVTLTVHLTIAPTSWPQPPRRIRCTVTVILVGIHEIPLAGRARLNDVVRLRYPMRPRA
jgi:hypothetical protein